MKIIVLFTTRFWLCIRFKIRNKKILNLTLMLTRSQYCDLFVCIVCHRECKYLKNIPLYLVAVIPFSCPVAQNNIDCHRHGAGFCCYRICGWLVGGWSIFLLLQEWDHLAFIEIPEWRVVQHEPGNTFMFRADRTTGRDDFGRYSKFSGCVWRLGWCVVEFLINFQSFIFHAWKSVNL